MIELFTAPTPNGWKVSIMLEECGIDYQARIVDLADGQQHTPAFLRISPNGRIPAIVDHSPEGGDEPLSVFESGAILLYLADKTGQFLPSSLAERTAAVEWLFWQVGGLGPMLGQHGHFKLYAPERLEYPTARYHNETLRLYSVLDRRLSTNEYLGGESYSIADMACFPWIQTYRAQEVDLPSFSNLYRWYEQLKQRPALRCGLDVGRDLLKTSQIKQERAWKNLFEAVKEQS